VPADAPAATAADAEPAPPDGALAWEAPPRQPTNGDLPRRAQPVAAGSEPLATRTPGTHLSHRPLPPIEPSEETRPRPERVHDLLTRHSRGVREGQTREDRP
jgi:hypothetical protein